MRQTRLWWPKTRAGPSASFTAGVEQRRLALLMLAVAALAWLILVLTHGGSSPSPFDHSQLGGPSAGHPTAVGAESRQVGVVLAGWSVMVVAMMLPPALPLLLMVRRLVSQRRHPAMLTALAAVAFVAAWIVVGAGLVAGDAALHTLITGEAHESRQHLVTGAVLLGAGLYELSPLKKLCLRACRSPRSFALAHWRGQRPPPIEVLAVTRAYALSCIGCCWALMVVCFAVGLAALPAMVVLAVLMAAERLVTWGQRLVLPAGLTLMVLGVVIMVGLLPAELLAR